LFSLIDLFSTKVNVEVESIFAIHIHGKKDDEKTQLACRLLGDLAVVASLKRSLKDAHKAFQDYGNAFDNTANQFIANGRKALKKKNAQTDDVTNRLKSLWATTQADHLLSTCTAMVMRCKHTTSKYQVLKTLMASRMPDRRYDQQINDLRTDGQAFFKTLEKLYPAIDDFPTKATSISDFSLIDVAVADVLGPTRQAAQYCDSLLLRAEEMNAMVSDGLQTVLPGQPYVVEALNSH
jgi:hypothetical protein